MDMNVPQLKRCHAFVGLDPARAKGFTGVGHTHGTLGSVAAPWTTRVNTTSRVAQLSNVRRCKQYKVMERHEQGVGST